MKSGLGVGLVVMGMMVTAAACEHEMQRAPAREPANFESTVPKQPIEPQMAPMEPTAKADPEGRGHTDRFLWDDSAKTGGAEPEAVDAGSSDAGRDGGK